MKKALEFLVVLAPALLTAVLVFAIEVVPRVYHRLHEMAHSASDVEWVKELVMHSAFYGTVVAAVLGFKKDAHETALLAGVWFVALLYLSRFLAIRLEELEEKDKSTAHRKNAGTTRSIVRNELEKATLLRKEDWVD